MKSCTGILAQVFLSLVIFLTSVFTSAIFANCRQCEGYWLNLAIMAFNPNSEFEEFAFLRDVDNDSLFGQYVNAGLGGYPGYRLDFGYRIPQTNNDIFFNLIHYYRLHVREIQKHLNGPEIVRILADPQQTFQAIVATSVATSDTSALVDIQILDAPVDIARARVVSSFDQIDLGVGQTVNLGNCFKFHIGGGVRYTYLDQTFNVVYNGKGQGAPVELINAFDPPVFNDPPFFDVVVTNLVFITENVRQYTQFQGLGFFIGSSFEYRFKDRYYLQASATTGFSIGETRDNVDDTIFRVPDFTLDILSGSLIFPVTNFLAGTSPRDNINFTREPIRVVPSLEGKLGFGVTKCCCKSFTFGAEVGYEYHQYFKALDRLTGVTSPFSVNIPSTSLFRTVDITFQGPYLELKMIY